MYRKKRYNAKIKIPSVVTVVMAAVGTEEDMVAADMAVVMADTEIRDMVAHMEVALTVNNTAPTAAGH